MVLDFLTLAIAVLGLSFLVTVFATMFQPVETFDRVFSELFGYSIFSIGTSYALLHLIRHLLSFKFSLPDWSSGALWLPAIFAGTFLFTFFAFDAKFFGHFDPYGSFLIAALIPASIFRLPVICALSFWEERKRKGTPVSFIR